MIGRVKSIGKGGVGIIPSEKGVVLIEGVIDGELIEYEISGKRKSVLWGKSIEIIEESPFRVKPDCSFYESCGGCNLRHIKYEHQLDIKKEILINNLKKIGKYQHDSDIEMIPSYKNRYRTRTIFKIKNSKIGFYKRGTNEVVEIDDCLLVSKIVKEFIKGLKNDKKIKKIDKGEIIVLTNGDNISAVLKEKGGKRFLTKERELVFKVGSFNYKFNPMNFIQSNLFMLEKMISILKDEMENRKYDVGIDLFSGVGFFTVLLSKYIHKGYSYEISKENIRAQRDNLKINSVNNIKVIKKDIIKAEISDADIYLADPPRGGLTRRIIKKIIKNNPKKISVFSCDSATFSRDLFYFSEYNYKPSKIMIIDNFPQTDHFEIFSVFEK
jgi:23S rRNA (uracil1939-C5)-methyltransferase